MHGRPPLLPLMFLILLAFFLSLTVAVPAKASETVEREVVVVYYFHGTVRCETCLFIEAMTEGTLRADFPEKLLNGSLVWRTLSVGLPENAHFVKDFDLETNELVVLSQHKNGHTTWEKIPDIWNLAADPSRFSQRLREIVARFLEMRT